MPRNVDPGTIKKGSGMANQDSVDSNSFTDEVIEGQNHGLEAHLKDPQGAHPASAISTTGSGGIYYGDDVQENLDELAALVPPRPPTIGNFSTFLAFTGIPDWGRLKLEDAGFVARGEVTPPDPTQPTNDFFVFNEFWWPPFEAQNIFPLQPNPPGNVFVVPGNDPSTDPTFNVIDVASMHQGGLTRLGPIIETARIRGSGDFETNVSGSVYPADRGVIALFHWPPGGGVVEFLAQPLTTRVVAAILCGQGINGECDGQPGGIFEEGVPDVFAFPGRATGQYDLEELHAGVDNQTGDPLPGGPNPSAGQVRLGTDPAAGVPVVVGGIPILGATSIATGGGEDTNFFRYRLPYLDDYSTATGIEYTPAIQKPRYFEKPPISLNPGVDLTQAGDYADFVKDYWTFQLARYRHQFDIAAADAGAWILLHFKRETDFESFARDGIMPDDLFLGYEIWSAEMINYANPESTDNLIDLTNPLEPVTSSAYHVHRSAVYTDEGPPLVNTALVYGFAREPDEVMFVSGVQYFLPNGSGMGTNWQIETLTFGLNNLWANAYRMGFNAGPTDITPGLTHMNPAILYLGIGTADQNIINGLGAGYTGTAFYQRVDFDYVDLDSVSGPFDLATGPTTISSADIILLGGDTPITFAGDDLQCHFGFNARVRAFARRPFHQEDPTPGMVEYTFPNPGGVSLLMHTTSHSPSFSSLGDYGNFKTTNPGDFPPRINLENSRKDVEERFYDEVYRVADSAMIGLDPTYNVIFMVGNLVGPGLPFPATPIELPVRFASEIIAVFGFASYLRTDLHLEDLATSALVSTEAQVSGLPDRSPPATDGVENPCPFSGMLIYPQINYTVGFRPSVGAGDTAVAQFNYAGVADPYRVYLRVFDAAYINDVSPEPGVVGQPFLTFRIDGIELADFAYVPFGPGGTLIALEVKIPGYTTWMDVGRTDGDGPSKQDPLVDGAGCQIIDPNATFDGRDPVTGTVFCQVRINVGPAATVVANTGVTTAPVGVAPVMVRARIKLAGIPYNFTQGGPDASSGTPRALTGITLLRHSNGQGPNDTNPFGPPAFP
jgi:hypothetical protein